ncbi:MAG: PilZ domain-containing protein, partial [Myxococcales bacterium]|nr:PilZ domain-containing protein [Myxococcales bacterium]
PALPVIPQTAMAALRRISEKVAVPRPAPEPAGALERARRVVVPVDVAVELPDGSTRATVARDISTTGLFLMLRDDIDLGAELGLDLELPAGDGLAVTRHRCWARVVRRTGDGYGLVLIDPAPDLIETIAALAV